MFLLCLLTCLALSTFSAQAKVVDNECNNFFYEGTKPDGMDQNAKGICQKLEYDDFLYATLYSVPNRIPLYSAYIFEPKGSGSSSQKWHIEPQLCHKTKPDHMMLEGEYEDVNTLKINQAISSDYENTGYDRGHLYPNSFKSGEDRKATFTLTNAAPMDACFNRVHWKLWEGYLQSFLDDIHNFNDKGTAYIVTGTVPGEAKIPQSENQGRGRVTVPSHIWTAVCYAFGKKSFSFGYIGKNQPEFNIKLMSVSEMNVELDKLYKRSKPSVKIFKDDCFSDKPESENAKIKFLNRIKLPEHQKLQMSEDAQKNFLAVQNVISSDSDSSSAKKPKITQLTATLAFDSLSSFSTSAETLKRKNRSACLLTGGKKRRKSEKRDSLRKREVSEGSESVECQLVPEKSVDGKTAADGSPCNGFVNNGYECTCFTQEGKSKSCCSTPCLYHDQLKGYHCYSGETMIQCSPQYSLITVEGNRCQDDHPCATYDKDYYWCYIDDNSWEFCSPPLWASRTQDGKYCRSDYACAKYKEEKPWCYTDDDNNWNYCCTTDDYFSTVNHKTCNPDKPCGYYGKNYLWCYTTDGNWDYCCKEFK